MSTHTPDSSDYDVVRAPSPRGLRLRARVIERDPIGAVGEKPRNILTVANGDRRWRVDEADVDPVATDTPREQ